MCLGCNRRKLMWASAAAVLTGFKAVTASASPACVTIGSGLPTVCAWDAAAVDDFQVFSTSGRKQIDHSLIAELKKIVAVIPVNPGFKFINDASPNAFAAPKTIVSGTNGTVFIGLNLINSEFDKSEYGGVAVAGICAHECGHIYQFNSQWAQKLAGPTAQRMELHADFLAGFFIGRDKSHAKDKAEIFANSLFAKGDFDYNGRHHHGTPQQRVAAMRKGYEVGETTASIESAAQTGADFVGNL